MTQPGASRAGLSDAAIASHPTEPTMLDSTTTDASLAAAGVTPHPAARQWIRNIGRNRGKARLWIEGRACHVAGLVYGTRYAITPHRDRLGFDLRPADEGRVVSGREDRPVIDIATSALLDPIVARGGRVTITFDGCTAGLSVRLYEGA